MIELRLPWPPGRSSYMQFRCVNNVPYGYITSKGVDYRDAAADKIAIVANGSPKFFPLEGRLAITIHCHPPTRRKYDLDNVAKPLLDSLVKGGLVVDDEQFDTLTLHKCEKQPPGLCIVQIDEIE